MSGLCNGKAQDMCGDMLDRLDVRACHVSVSARPESRSISTSEDLLPAIISLLIQGGEPSQDVSRLESNRGPGWRESSQANGVSMCDPQR